VTPGDGEDDAFYFVKIETTDSVDDDFDHWRRAALDQIIARDPGREDARFMGAALKYGNDETAGGVGGFASPPVCVGGVGYRTAALSSSCGAPDTAASASV